MAVLFALRAVAAVIGSALLAVIVVGAYRSLRDSVWRGPQTIVGRVVRKRIGHAQTGSLAPPTGAAILSQSTNWLCIDVDGHQRELTATDEVWGQVQPGQSVKLMVYGGTHAAWVKVLGEAGVPGPQPR